MNTKRNKIMWIDVMNSKGYDIKTISDRLFPDLWMLGFDNEVRILTNPEKEEESLKTRVLGLQINDNLYKIHDECPEAKFIKRKVNDLRKRSSNPEEDFAKEIKLDKNINMKDIFSTINNAEEYIYMLQLILTEEDKKLDEFNLDRNDIDAFSMKIYNYITTVLKAPCVLYSKVSYKEMIQERWKANYIKKYEDANKNDFIMYHSDLFCDFDELGEKAFLLAYLKKQN